MAPRKLKTEKFNDSKKKMGRSSSNPVEDTHLRLQTSFMKTQIVMVYDDSTIETPRSNEVELCSINVRNLLMIRIIYEL